MSHATLTPSPTLRAGRPDDATDCGRICYEAFKAISEQHNFPPDFPSAEVATGLMSMLMVHPAIHSVIAEEDGRIIGSNFLWEHDSIAGVGPITVDVKAQNSSSGRRLMGAVLERAEARQFAGIRLVQAAFHSRSLSLYTKLGFDVREPLACITGSLKGVTLPGRTVRAAHSTDLAACNDICRGIHGHDRANELAEAVARGTATIVEHASQLTGYATAIGFFGHAVGRTNDDLKALIAGAPEISGPGLLLPSRNAELFRWCLAQGLRVTQPLTLMSKGVYHEPAGAFLPSILF